MDRLPPQNIEAEAAVLGSVLIDPQALSVVAEVLRPADFYRDGHRLLFQAAIDLFAKGHPADLVTLTDELERRNQLEQAGGADYITMLVNTVPTSANIEHYAQIVERTAILRKLIHVAGQIAALAYAEPDAMVALDKAEQLLFGVSQNVLRADFEHIRDILDDYYEKLDLLHRHRGDIVGVPSGFADLDKITGGLQKSDLIILAARPAVGKTALALSLAHNAAVKHGKSIAMFSLEMSKEQLAQRLLSMDAGVDQQRLRTGYISDVDDEWTRIGVSVGRLSDASIYIDDSAGITMLEMRSKARRLMAEHGFDLLIIDYLQLMQGTGSRGEGNRQQEISEISRGLKGLARELNVPVLALSQLSRAVESRAEKVPQLSDLRESGCLAGESLVYLPDFGVYERIDKLAGRSGFNVLALNTATWKLEPAPVTRAFATGRKPVFKLTTRLGRTVRATANHKFLTINGWQRLDELEPGMRLAMAQGNPTPNRLRRCASAATQAIACYASASAASLPSPSADGEGKPTELHRFEQIAVGISKGVERAAKPAPTITTPAYAGGGTAMMQLSPIQIKRSLRAYKETSWDSIIAIEVDGDAEVFDLTVDGLHNFVCQDYIAHNSIEQDADVVMFIYRDEVYNPETERPNIADIIIAKHRNGPIGTISLYFQREQTRYRDLELQRVNDF